MTLKEILINEKDYLLLEAGIRIPKGTQAAKIIYHQDLDGVFFSISTYQQLLKQGIPSKNIKLSGIQYGDNNQKVKKQLSAKKGQMVALVDFARIGDDVRTPDFWSDHHKQPEGKKSVAKSGSIGAEKYPSDTEHIATAHARNILDGKTIEAVSRVDSAKYTDIDQILELPFNFKDKNRMERLAIMTQAIFADAGLYRNKNLMESLIKNVKPSLLSVFNFAVKYANLADKQKEAIKELEKEKPDWNKINQVRKEMPSKESAKDIQSSKQSARTRLKEMTENLMDKFLYEGEAKDRIEKIRQQRSGSVEKHTDKEKTGFEQKGSLMHQNTMGVQRYLWSRLHEKGVRSFFTIRQIGSTIQVSVNPDIPKEIKEKIDLSKVAQDILNELKLELGKKYGWAFKIIEKESGGHKGITNIAGLHLIGLMPKEDRERLKTIQGYEQRIKDFKTLGSRKLPSDLKEKLEQLKKDLKSASKEEKKEIQKKIDRLTPTFKKVMPQKYAEKKELETKKELSKEDQRKAIEMIKKGFQKRLDALSKDFPKLAGKEKYRIK